LPLLFVQYSADLLAYGTAEAYKYGKNVKSRCACVATCNRVARMLLSLNTRRPIETRREQRVHKPSRVRYVAYAQTTIARNCIDGT